MTMGVPKTMGLSVEHMHTRIKGMNVVRKVLTVLTRPIVAIYRNVHGLPLPTE